MRYFKNTWFKRFARKHKISNDSLKNVVKDLEEGRINANYGGYVYKQRVPRSGEGKSGGYRTIVLFKSEYRSFFVYGFEKSVRKNIENDEVAEFKKIASDSMVLTDDKINEMLTSGELEEF